MAAVPQVQHSPSSMTVLWAETGSPPGRADGVAGSPDPCASNWDSLAVEGRSLTDASPSSWWLSLRRRCVRLTLPATAAAWMPPRRLLMTFYETAVNSRKKLAA